MRAQEFITEHRLVWKKTPAGLKLFWRCESGPRKNRTVPMPSDCSAAPDMAKAQRMKTTRKRTQIRQSKKTKRAKKINPQSRLAARLNKYR
jgi:hypothetical protein